MVKDTSKVTVTDIDAPLFNRQLDVFSNFNRDEIIKESEDEDEESDGVEKPNITQETDVKALNIYINDPQDNYIKQKAYPKQI